MPAVDRLGLSLGTTSDAAAAYVDGVDRLLAAWPGAQERLDAALRIDPAFALGHAAAARALQMRGDVPGARAAAERAREHAASTSPRERGHVEAVARLVEGDAAGALAAVEQQLDEHPTDSLVLSLALGAFGLLAFSGRADHDAARLALCRRLAPSQPGDDWWFLGYLGWAHTEAGNLDEGLRITERAMVLRRENAHGAHMLAHAFHERGEHGAAVAHLDDWLAGYPRHGQLHCHLHWHRALLELADDDVDAALARYREHMRPAVSASPPINVMTDGASLFWRVTLYRDDGVPRLPWDELATYASSNWPRPAVPFIDVHCAMSAAGAGDAAAAQRRAAALRELDAAGRMPPGAVPAALSEALAAYAEGEHAAAADAVEAVLAELPRLGGSHVQREVHEETLIAACLRCGRRERARELLRARLARRPSRQDRRWLDACERA